MRKESRIKKFAKVLALSLALSLTVQTAAPVSNAVVVSAAIKVKLNVTRKSLSVGDSFTLKVNGTSKKVTFSSNKKSVAAVNAKGVVVANKKGNAVITASVGGSKYTCKVTVKEPSMVANAPFPAKEVKIESSTVVIMPEEWDYSKQTENNVTVHGFAPKGSVKNGILLTSTEMEGIDNSKFDLYIDVLRDTISADNMKLVAAAQVSGDFTVEDFSIVEGKQKFPQGRVAVISCNIKQEGKILMTFKVFNLFAADHVVQLTVISDGTETTPNVDEVANYMMKSLTFTK